MKRYSDDGGYGSGSKRSRVSEADGGNELRLLIPSKGAGAVIGKGGENIKNLRSDFGASVTIPDSNAPERIILIRAELDNICEIVNQVIPKLDEGRHSDGGESELKILVHQSQAGAIIGRAGFKIKELRDATNTAIKVFSECAPASTDRVVHINGEASKIVQAMRQVLEICFETPVKGMNKPYDTINYDPGYVYDYGGYPMERGGGGGNFRGGRGGGRGGRGGRGGYGGGGGPPRADMMGRGGGRYGGEQMMDYPPMGDMGPPMGGRGGGPQAPMPMMDFGGGPPQTAQVTIPKDLAGTIIGKGGERINRIREDSGAHIVVDPPAPGSDERIITISGTPQQIQMAQYLLQQCVRSSVAGRKYIQQQSHR